MESLELGRGGSSLLRPTRGPPLPFLPSPLSFNSTTYLNSYAHSQPSQSHSLSSSLISRAPGSLAFATWGFLASTTSYVPSGV